MGHSPVSGWARAAISVSTLERAEAGDVVQESEGLVKLECLLTCQGEFVKEIDF